MKVKKSFFIFLKMKNKNLPMFYFSFFACTKNEDKSLHFFRILKNENDIFHFCISIFICQKKARIEFLLSY